MVKNEYIALRRQEVNTSNNNNNNNNNNGNFIELFPFRDTTIVNPTY